MLLSFLLYSLLHCAAGQHLNRIDCSLFLCLSLHVIGVFIYSTGVESPDKLVELEAELHNAEEHLVMTSSEHEELLHVVQNQQASKRAVDILS